MSPTAGPLSAQSSAPISAPTPALTYPAFFDEAPLIFLRDPLAEFLSATQGGILEYGYLDAVKLAGHSCPTVAAAYNLTRLCLATLYGDQLPERGGIRVAFADKIDGGASGVIASVVTLLTGAAGDGGFPGLAGRFSRRQLLAFGTEQPLAFRFTRIDDGTSVAAEVDLSPVPAVPGTSALLQRCLSGSASAAERASFGQLWQDRVRRILIDHADDPAVFQLQRRPGRS